MKKTVLNSVVVFVMFFVFQATVAFAADPQKFILTYLGNLPGGGL